MGNALIFAGEQGGGHNPIVPAANEVIWGSIAFIVLFILIAKLAYPRLKQGLDARSERIRKSLDDAERAREEAQRVLEEYRGQLAEARNEAARLIEEARQSAEQVRQDLRKKAEAEAAEIKQRAQDDIAAQVSRTMADLQARVSLMAIQLAEKIVEKNLDEDANRELIERYINEVGSRS